MKIVAAFAVALIALTGCSGEEAVPAPTVTVTAVPQITSPQEEFTQLIDDEFGPYTDSEKAKVLETGYMICEAIDTYGAEFTIENVVKGLDSNASSEMFGFFAGAAVVTICPEHQQEVLDYMADYSVQ